MEGHCWPVRRILKILNLEAAVFRFFSVSLEIRASSSGCRMNTSTRGSPGQ